MDQVHEQLARAPFQPPSFSIIVKKEIDQHKMDDFMVINYNYHPAIKAKMSA